MQIYTRNTFNSCFYFMVKHNGVMCTLGSSFSKNYDSQSTKRLVKHFKKVDICI